MNTLSQFIQLISPYWLGPKQWLAWLLLFGTLSASLAIVQISVLINEWNKAFYDALTAFQTELILPLMWQYLGYIAIVVLLITAGNWLRKLLLIRWRTHLTRELEQQWLVRHRLYGIAKQQIVDNPDQRITQDSYLLAEKSIDLVKYFCMNVAKIIAFVGILWQLSGIQHIQLGGIELTIQGYLVWLALIYTAICSLLTHGIGRKLKPLNVEKEKAEATYRSSLIRINDNAEQIAFYDGEKTEQQRLIAHFNHIVRNWHALMAREFKLESFSAAYLRITMLIPVFAVLPLYLIKAITFGAMMQARSAFSSVQDGFGWFMDFYKQIMEWAAAVQRLSEFKQSLNALTKNENAIIQQGQQLQCEQVQAYLSPTQPLFQPVNLRLMPGQWLQLQGDSGVGKSTFLRILAGLWQDYQGTVILPVGKICFVPQKAYLAKDRLANVLCYPQTAVKNAAVFCRILTAVGLPHLIDELEQEKDWGQVLSGGEQQRIAFARLLLNQPDFICMDESTNQLDILSARYLLNLLRQMLPNCTLIAITHQPELNELFEQQVELIKISEGT